MRDERFARQREEKERKERRKRMAQRRREKREEARRRRRQRRDRQAGGWGWGVHRENVGYPLYECPPRQFSGFFWERC